MLNGKDYSYIWMTKIKKLRMSKKLMSSIGVIASFLSTVRRSTIFDRGGGGVFPNHRTLISARTPIV